MEDLYPDLAELADQPLPRQPSDIPAKPPEGADLQKKPDSKSASSSGSPSPSGGSPVPTPPLGIKQSDPKPSGSVETGVRLCNRSSERISAAVGYRFTSGGSWRSKGWYALGVGECAKVITSASPGETFYVYAKGANGSYWGKGYDLCVRDGEKFFIQGTDNCEGRGYRTASFTKTSVASGQRYLTYSFTGGRRADPKPTVATQKGVKLCNNSREKIYAAIGYKLISSSPWRTKGWYALERGQCATPLTSASPGETFYVYAKGANGSRWGKGYDLCVRDGKEFRISGTANCESRGYRTAGFSRIKVASNSHSIRHSFTGGRVSP